MMLLIRSARVIDRLSPHDGQVVDVLIDNGLIRQIGTSLAAPEGVRIVEADDLHLSPGWFDARVAGRDPGFEHKETLAETGRVAAAGGFTDIALLPNTKPAVDTKDTLGYLRQAATGLPVAMHPIAAITRRTEGEDFAEMMDLHRAGAVAFSDGEHPLHHPDLFLKTLDYLRPFGGLLMNRPEEPLLTRYGQMHEGVASTLLGLRGMPALAEELALARDLRLLEYALERNDLSVASAADDRPVLHVSLLSSAGAVEMVRQAKRRGLPVSADVAAHQLVFIDEDLSGFDTRLKVNPPFRQAADRDALWAGLADGTIDALVSDHRPHDDESKNLEFDLAEFGITGLETLFAAVQTHNAGRLPLGNVVDALTHAPRRILRLPNVSVAEGQPARLTLFQPNATWTYQRSASHARNSPFWRQPLTGCVVGTVVEGHFNETKI